MSNQEQPAQYQPPGMKLVQTSFIPVRWGDMDAFGHVNNTVYFRYMEQVRIEWMVAYFDMASTSKTGPVLINAQCSFLNSIKYPDQIEVQMFITSPGRSSFDSFYRIYRLDARLDAAKTLCAEGSAKIVWVDYALERSVPLPEVVLDQFR